MFSRAPLCLLLVPWLGCVLDTSVKTSCRTDRDCNRGRVCRAFQCTASDTVVVDGDGGERQGEQDAASGPPEDAGEPPQDEAASDASGDAELDAAARDASLTEDAGAMESDAAGDGAGATCACEQAEAHVTWRFPSSAEGFYAVDQPVVVRSAEGAVSWVEDLYFLAETAVGATIGFENEGRRPDGSIGKVAVFSMSGVTDTYGDATCEVSAGPEPWTTCRIAFDFVPGREYVWRIWKLADVSSLWWWWGAWILDAQGPMAEVPIAELRGPPGRSALARAESSVRYGDREGSCAAPPASRIHFVAPLLDGVGARAQNPALGPSSVPGCHTASVTFAAGGIDVAFGDP